MKLLNIKTAPAPIMCPECGARDPARFQITFPAWFRVNPEYLGDARAMRRNPLEIIFTPAEHVDTDVEAQAEIYCEACDHVSDARNFAPGLGQIKWGRLDRPPRRSADA